MFIRNFPAILLLLGAATFGGGWKSVAAPALTPEHLRCEYRVDPCGLDETAPRLSWYVTSKKRDERQTACQVIVAATEKDLADGKANLWNSGKIATNDTTALVYGGRPLGSGQICYWKVRVWDKDDHVSDWSRPALWSMGLLHQEDWHGSWIGYDKVPEDAPEAASFGDAKWIWFAGDKLPDVPMETCQFMSQLDVPATARIDKAELMLAVDDDVSFNINGQTVPMAAITDHNAHLFDVTSQIKPGANLVRVQVANTSRGPAGLIVRLDVTTAGGKIFTLISDDSWRGTNNGGENWHIRAIAPTEWPAVQVIGAAGIAPWGELKYSHLFLPPPPYLRTEFQVSKKIKKATLYVTALGLADFYIDGHRVSEDRFNPGWTDYTKRVHYRAYEVAHLLHRGPNVLGAILADGWYSGFIGWGQKRDHYGKKPRLRAELRIDFTDGTQKIVATGPNWKASTGGIREADFLMGESFDARREQNWSEPGFQARNWDAVATGAEMNPRIEAHPGPAVGMFAELTPKSITEIRPGVYVLDMGQNFAGVERLKIKGRPGQKITLRFAERLNPDGSIYTINLRGALATDSYICRGHGVETWEPRFTYHGYQYIEVTGLTQKPEKDTITGIALSSETTDTGKFTCSDPMLNRLAKNIYWTQRANFIDIPTDCPQRDERLGWMGDAQVYLRTATLNEDVQAFFTKWLVDVQDGQRADGEFPMVAPVKVAGDDGGPGWADAGVICPWTIYEVDGDKRILEKHYASMARFIAFCKNRSTPDLLPPAHYHCFGDWLNINDETPKDVICTAYFGYSTKLMARIAEALGKTDEAAKYNDLFTRIKAAFNRAYVQADGKIRGDTQTDYVLALAFDLLDPDQQQRAAQHLIDNIQKRDWHLSTGFIGTKNLMLTLAKIGRDDVAYRLIHNKTFPSWGFSIAQGATSIWERWDGWTPEKGFQDPGMNSFAHYSFGAVYQWMAENIGGIRTDTIAYRHIVIAPQPDDKMTSADTIYCSIQGPIETHWTKRDGHFHLKTIIPANTTATVIVPAADVESVRESGGAAQRAAGVKFIRAEEGHVTFEVASGNYDFETP